MLRYEWISASNARWSSMDLVQRLDRHCSSSEPVMQERIWLQRAQGEGYGWREPYCQDLVESIYSEDRVILAGRWSTWLRRQVHPRVTAWWNPAWHSVLELNHAVEPGSRGRHPDAVADASVTASQQCLVMAFTGRPNKAFLSLFFISENYLSGIGYQCIGVDESRSNCGTSVPRWRLTTFSVWAILVNIMCSH